MFITRESVASLTPTNTMIQNRGMHFSIIDPLLLPLRRPKTNGRARLTSQKILLMTSDFDLYPANAEAMEIPDHHDPPSGCDRSRHPNPCRPCSRLDDSGAGARLLVRGHEVGQEWC